MRNIDFSSWQALLTTMLGLAMVTLIGVGFRLLAMYAIQQRRERENRQINERLRTLIAAYKTLGGSFTGNLAVDPAHLRGRREAAIAPTGGDRARRMRDSVEAALSDIILLGTERQARLAAKAAEELVAGRLVHTDELVVSLRAFIREALGLDALPGDLAIPRQGPTRPGANSRKGEGESGRGSKGGGGMGGMGMGGAGLGAAHHDQTDDPHRA
jgi:hypothetical protein